ncbi:MAG: hypothetical protein HOQ45_19790 [Nocardioidaceae bacterium]|nr:hypothetical protein [Nocardioidaceae bacterium]
MDDRLRTLRSDVEDHLALPEFAVVQARARGIQRRRTAIATAAVVLVTAVTAVTVARLTDTTRSAPPVDRPPTLKVDSEEARRVLRDPRAQLDTDLSRVDGTGSMLAVVRVTKPSFRTQEARACPRGSSVLRWTSWGGSRHVWLDAPREVRALPAGFVLGAPPRECRGPRQHGAYFVDADGHPRSITWTHGARRVCAPDPRDPRCRFNLFTGKGTLLDVDQPRGTKLLTAGRGGPWWAASKGDRRLYWSADGRTWRHQDSGWPDDAIPSASAVGRWGVLAGGTQVLFTHDAGATWEERDLAPALSGLEVADVDWTVTRRGTLLGVTQLVGRGDVLFRSTDASWTRFVQSPVHTSFGLVRPVAVAEALYVVDDERWAVSLDDGAHWRRTPPIP